MSSSTSSSSTSGSSNIFENVLTDLQGVENDLLGPAYPYYENINAPNQGNMNMSSDGTLQALAQDIEGLIAYVEVLVEGGGNASIPGGALGNKFFLQTGAKCLDTETNEQVDRYIYIDNVPDGNIPFVSSGLGVNFTQFEGLIPGALSDLNVFNPYAILQSFLSGSMPKCQSLTMETIDINNVTGQETQFVTLTDIQNMDPCTFSNGSNPVSGSGCVNAFTNYSDSKNIKSKYKSKYKSKKSNNIGLPKDLTAQLYFASLALIGVFILYKIMEKSK